MQARMIRVRPCLGAAPNVYSTVRVVTEHVEYSRTPARISLDV
jgi:hypothetical protein